MIITKQKSLGSISKQLDGKSKIFIVGCGECATTCGTGSEQAVVKIKQWLESGGKEVTGWAIPDAPCVAAQIKTALAKNTQAVKQSDAFLVLACGSGIQSVKESDRRNLLVASGCDTLFAATVDAKGDFQERCSACGECVLELTAGICPVTRCSKGLLNGPCGGVKDGKCEADRQRDCAWVLIYKELSGRNNLDLFKRFKPPKDFAKQAKPHFQVVEK